MTLLSAIKVGHYRSFLHAQLELRPLTLLYGDNNVGKSALLRLLPILYDACATTQRTPGLDMSSAALRGATLKELRTHDALAPEGQLTLELTSQTDQGLLRAIYVLSSQDRPLSKLTLKLLAHPEVTLRWLEGEHPMLRLNDSQPTPCPIRFEGLRPILAPDQEAAAPAALRALASALRQLQPQAPSTRSRCGWISARHASSPRELERLPALPALDSRGEFAPHHLRADETLRQTVSSWYEQSANQALVIEPRRPDHSVFALALRSTRDAAWQMPLHDSGEGFAQVLPVLTGLAMVAQRDRFGLDALAIEEPEAGLHVSRHEALMGAMIKTLNARQDDKPTLLIETHARPLLWSALLSVARGDLAPEDIAIHWVYKDERGASCVTRAHVHADGTLSGWPDQAFKAELTLSSKLADAQEAWSPPLG